MFNKNKDNNSNQTNIQKLTKEEQKERDNQIKLLQREIQTSKNHLRFSLSVVSSRLIKEEIKPYKKIAKTLRNSNMAYSVSEFENLINEIITVIQTPINLFFVIEDSMSGDMFYFDDLQLQPNRNVDLLSFIKNEISQFPHVNDSNKVFIDINRQFSEEGIILERTDELLTLQNKNK